MPVELVVPSVGESITEVEIGDWLKKPGDTVDQDEPVVVIETEKVTVELPAPAAGTISSMLKKKGDKASIGDVIGYIETNGSRATPAPARADAHRPAEIPRPAEREPKGLTPLPSVPQVRQSGRDEQIVPMTPIRRRIAQRLVEAQKSAALLTTFNQIDMSGVIALRKQHQDAFQAKYRIKLGFMSFFVKASIEALKLIPQVNAEIRGNDIVYRNYYDIGIAVGGGKGLVVPVLRNAERMSFAEVERAIADFAQRAGANQLRVDELQGGTFTISNGGIYGSMLSTPIVNPPQSGVLGLHAIEDRPVARDGAVVIRPMMYVALTYDHRIVDGREAVTFLTRIKEVIEEPARLLLEV
jgi:2-oxoglutarate dehydrogenase E2 component (dihydrolipoamide succinyltransferase)